MPCGFTSAPATGVDSVLAPGLKEKLDVVAGEAAPAPNGKAPPRAGAAVTGVAAPGANGFCGAAEFAVLDAPSPKGKTPPNAGAAVAGAGAPDANGLCGATEFAILDAAIPWLG